MECSADYCADSGHGAQRDAVAADAWDAVAASV